MDDEACVFCAKYDCGCEESKAFAWLMDQDEPPRYSAYEVAKALVAYREFAEGKSDDVTETAALRERLAVAKEALRRILERNKYRTTTARMATEALAAMEGKDA